MADKLTLASLGRPDVNYLSGTAVAGPYRTALPIQQELAFRQWVNQNRIPFDDSPTSDYDMRGFYQAMMSGDPAAATQVSTFDGLPHFPDTYKTPYHRSFSRESKYATENAPTWQGDRLVNKLGSVLIDETPKKGKR